MIRQKLEVSNPDMNRNMRDGLKNRLNKSELMREVCYGTTHTEIVVGFFLFGARVVNQTLTTTTSAFAMFEYALSAKNFRISFQNW